ncbi:ABC transporter substrate-binding protein [Siccirubricoccus phaeus]|uniref:ABC transporter substrate-binding protein n=1 Tax=Siccirubricoccus phaeus TaxID=2595053 RepID=UPI0011F1AB89|nr:ABC transporter substrate-binding protein [Siccirubricoccus phaeus]
MSAPLPNRRALLRGLGVAGLAAPLGAMAPRAFAPADPVAELLAAPPICRTATTDLAEAAVPGPRRKLKLAWSQNGICTAAVPSAEVQGIYARHNLDIEFVNWGGSTDQLLEALATGKADAGGGMALRWLKALEAGFDVKVTAAMHGGCMRLLSAPGSGVAAIADLRGKTIGAEDMASPNKNFFSIVAAKAGIDPVNEINWRQYPADLLSEALKRGDIQGFTLGDPMASILRDRDGLVEVSNNLSGEYAHRTCCILGISGKLVRQDRPVARAITAAILEAEDWVHANPDAAAEIFAKYAPRAPAPVLAAMLRSHTHNHHPKGADLEADLAAYIAELKLVKVIRPNTDPARLAARIHVDVLNGAPA